MFLNVLTQVVWDFYQNGRPKASEQSYSEAQISQYTRMAVGDICRFLFTQFKKMDNGEEYYFSSPLLSVQNFNLCDANGIGMRRADMTKFDLYRLPKNSHITNAYPQGCEDGDDGKSIPQVQPGEENFYAGKAKFKFYKFYVVKGRGINTYNLPPCIKSIDVEATFDGDEVDISLDVAFDAANQVLGTMLRIPGFVNVDKDNPYSLPQKNLKQRLQQAPEPTV